MQRTIFFSTFLLGMLFNGCTQTVNVRALEPAEVDRISQTKKITVTYFDNDKVGLSDKVEAELAKFQLDGKKYFTIVSRKEFDDVIREQKLQTSGLVDPEDAVKVGNIIGAGAIVSGHVSRPSQEDSYFHETRTRCADRKCKEMVYYQVRCIKRVSSLSADLRIVDVEQGDIIDAETYTRSVVDRHCNDDQNTLPSRGMAGQFLAKEIAYDFTYKLTPHYRNIQVTLLEDEDIDYSDRAEKLLEVSLEYIEQGRLDKAESLLLELVDETGEKSYVAFYNLGVVKEAQGKYQEAKEFYSYADNLMIEPVEEINRAVRRIEKLIAKRKQSMEQINR